MKRVRVTCVVHTSNPRPGICPDCSRSQVESRPAQDSERPKKLDPIASLSATRVRHTYTDKHGKLQVLYLLCNPAEQLERRCRKTSGVNSADHDPAIGGTEDP